MENKTQAVINQMFIKHGTQETMQAVLNVSLTSELGTETIQLSVFVKNTNQKINELQTQAIIRAKKLLDSACSITGSLR